MVRSLLPKRLILYSLLPLLASYETASMLCWFCSNTRHKFRRFC